jgi:DNA-directed RNA polymerase specialized sigma24 family protein
MSRARHSDEDAGSPDALRALFQRLAEGRESHTAREVWDAMLKDPWLQAEAKRRAMRFVHVAHLERHLADDLAQQALLNLLDKLKAGTSLHARADLLPHRFEGWIGTMFRHSFIDTVAKLCPKLPPHGMLTDAYKAVDYDVALEERHDKVTTALAKLEAKERSAVLMDLDGVKHTVIARKLGITYKELIGLLQRARLKLRKSLAEYRRDE